MRARSEASGEEIGDGTDGTGARGGGAGRHCRSADAGDPGVAAGGGLARAVGPDGPVGGGCFWRRERRGCGCAAWAPRRPGWRCVLARLRSGCGWSRGGACSGCPGRAVRIRTDAGRGSSRAAHAAWPGSVRRSDPRRWGYGGGRRRGRALGAWPGSRGAFRRRWGSCARRPRRAGSRCARRRRRRRRPMARLSRDGAAGAACARPCHHVPSRPKGRRRRIHAGVSAAVMGPAPISVATGAPVKYGSSTCP